MKFENPILVVRHWRCLGDSDLFTLFTYTNPPSRLVRLRLWTNASMDECKRENCKRTKGASEISCSFRCCAALYESVTYDI